MSSGTYSCPLLIQSLWVLALLNGVAIVRSQPTQAALHRAALEEAAKLVPGGARSAVTGSFYDLVVARQEQLLNKQASVAKWKSELNAAAAAAASGGNRRLLSGLADATISNARSTVVGEEFPPPPAPPPSSPPPPPVPTPFPPRAPPLPAGRAKYGQVLGLSWLFYEAQRSGKIAATGYRVPWRLSAHVNDTVPGGWYDAGDYLKLNFPLAPSVGLLAWGLIEFRDAYSKLGMLGRQRGVLRVAADYLHRCYEPINQTYVGGIGDPRIDHNFWGRAEEESGYRPALIYNQSMAAPDLYAGVASALASTAVLFKGPDRAWSDRILKTAVAMYDWSVRAKSGKYSNFYTTQTKSIYPSSGHLDSMAWAAGWLYRASGNTSYLNDALVHWNKGSGNADVFPSWDSVWAQHAVHMITLSGQGIAVPGIDSYKKWVNDVFLRAWLKADGFLDVVSTPLGLHYPRWNQWANLAFSTTTAAVVALHAKYEPLASAKKEQLEYVRQQTDYALGSGYRSFVAGWGYNPPQQPHHAGASCPDRPATCNWPQYSAKGPNPQILHGALVAGPAGVRKNATDPDNSYYDKRSDYVTNEVAIDYNAGLSTALAGIFQLYPLL